MSEGSSRVTTVATNVKAETMSLMDKRSALEAEMNAIVSRLTQPGAPGLSGNLLDFEGFPRSDIDEPAVRAERRRLEELRNDHKEVTEKINQNIQILHSARIGNRSSPFKNSDTQTSTTVDTVASTPAQNVLLRQHPNSMDVEAVLESLNLNPQLFLNEVLNTVDDVVEEAFNFFLQEASTQLNSEATQRSQNLRQGVDCVRERVQSVLDKQLAVWEKYCLHHCFALPQGFTMPRTGESSKNEIDLGALVDPDVDAQLDSLRKKLAEVGKESEMLNQEVQALERQTTLNARYINEAVKLYEDSSSHELFQEIMTTASELGTKVKNLNASRIEDTEQLKTKSICSPEMDQSAINPVKGLSNVKLDDLQDFVAIMKNIIVGKSVKFKIAY